MRKTYLDVAKGIGILLVVLGHALELYLGDGAGGTRGNGFAPATFAVWKFIYAFHMPLFFLLSGMATPDLAGTRLQRTLAGALHLILLATVLQLLFAPLRLAVSQPGASLPTALATVVWPAIKLETYALVVTWFLPCLALVRLAAWLVANTRRPSLVVVPLCLLCVAEHYAGIGYLQLRSVIVGLAFFAIGQRLFSLPEHLPRAAHAILFLAAASITALTFDANHGCWFSLARTCPGPRYGEFAVLMVSGAFGFLPLFALTALTGAAAVLSAACLVAGRAAQALSLVGRHTLDLLIVNGITLVFIQPLLAPAATRFPPPLVILPLVLAQVAAAFALHPLFDRFLNILKTVAARLASPAALVHQTPG